MVSFSVSVSVYNTEHSVELDDMDFRFLHEKLNEANGSAPAFTYPRWRLWETREGIDNRRINYQRYLSEVLTSPECVLRPILWVTLGVPAEAAVVQRFLVRGDNISQLEELSAHADQVGRLTSSSQVIGGIMGLILESAKDLNIVSAGATILGRVSSQRDTFRVFVEAKALTNLMRVLRHATGVALGILCDLMCLIVRNNPQLLFAYFQRDSGMTELIEFLDSEPRADPKAIETIAKSVWIGVSGSRDVEIAIIDKSSVGMALLNKLLVRGQGTETELIVSTILAYLSSKQLVPEYEEKIRKIIQAVVSDSTRHHTLGFLDDFIKVISLIGKNELLTQLGCHLVILQAVNKQFNNDDVWFERERIQSPLVQRLSSIVFSKSHNWSKATRAKAAEALLMIGSTDEIETLGELNSINNQSVADKIQQLNNFFIEANFDLSSRPIAGPFDDSILASIKSLFREVYESLLRVDQEQKELNAIHSHALNEVVSGMFEVKSLLKDTESAFKRNEQLRDECSHTISPPKVHEEQRENCDENAEFKAHLHELQSIHSTFRQLNTHVVRLNVEKFAGLVEAVGRIDSMMASSTRNISSLKGSLRKTKDIIEQVLEEIEAETTSSPVTP